MWSWALHTHILTYPKGPSCWSLSLALSNRMTEKYMLQKCSRPRRDASYFRNHRCTLAMRRRWPLCLGGPVRSRRTNFKQPDRFIIRGCSKKWVFKFVSFLNFFYYWYNIFNFCNFYNMHLSIKIDQKLVFLKILLYKIYKNHYFPPFSFEDFLICFCTKGSYSQIFSKDRLRFLVPLVNFCMFWGILYLTFSVVSPCYFNLSICLNR